MSETKGTHGIILENRKKAIMTGIKDIESFNENEMILITSAGGLRLRGRNFEIGKVNTESGELEMTGEINSVQYSNTDRTPNNVITKLFR
ncbi:MAG: sporulation protein YabP [Oscillospiraceae bacterium]|nr:sporulation protein YabP [Oscillospiraceae bacterium]